MSKLSERLREIEGLMEPVNSGDSAYIREAADLIDKLPVTADGKTMVPGMVVSFEGAQSVLATMEGKPRPIYQGIVEIGVEYYDGLMHADRLYSTPEALEAARREGE